MAWIKTVGEDQAVGRLAEIYQRYRGRNGMVPNIMQAFSLKPELMGAVANVVGVSASGATSSWRIRYATGSDHRSCTESSRRYEI
jgi:hypothetical protein